MGKDTQKTQRKKKRITIFRRLRVVRHALAAGTHYENDFKCKDPFSGKYVNSLALTGQSLEKTYWGVCGSGAD